MTDKEVMAMALDALETEVSIDWTNNDEFVASAEKMHEAITALKERLAQEKALQALHSENERLGLYKDAYAEPDLIARLRDTASKGVSAWGDLQIEAAQELEILMAERGCYASAMDRMLAQPEQEPVAHLWECLGRWSAYLVNNGTQAECAPPSWLVEAVKNATTPSQRTEQEPVAILNHAHDVHTFRNVNLKGLPDGEYLVYTHPPQRTEQEPLIGCVNHDCDKCKLLKDERLELIGHADLAINNIYIFNGYGEDVPEDRTPIYAGYKAAHGIKETT
jgi:hypothetical protein